MRKSKLYFVIFLFCTIAIGCTKQKEHTAPAIEERDSVAMMTSYGVNMLVSDSGVMKYRIIAERWEVNEAVNPQIQFFERGIFLEQFDENFHVQTYIQADTAINYKNEKKWHLIGHVKVKTVDGLRFWSDELWWDQNKHELYSNKYSHVVTPVRELEGAYFVSDENMRHYKITNTKGNFIREEEELASSPANGTPAEADTMPKRDPAKPNIPLH